MVFGFQFVSMVVMYINVHILNIPASLGLKQLDYGKLSFYMFLHSV